MNLTKIGKVALIAGGGLLGITLIGKKVLGGSAEEEVQEEKTDENEAE